jgi:hypothetical protein
MRFFRHLSAANADALQAQPAQTSGPRSWFREPAGLCARAASGLHPCRDSRHYLIIASDVACPVTDPLSGLREEQRSVQGPTGPAGV